MPLLKAVCCDNLKLTNINLSWVKVLKNSNFSVTHKIDEPIENVVQALPNDILPYS